MKGSIIAFYIDEEYKAKKALKDKQRQKCIIDNEKQCDKCKYFRICENREDKYEKMDETNCRRLY